MNGSMLIITPDDQRPRLVECTAPVTVEMVHELVGGHFELVPYFMSIAPIPSLGITEPHRCVALGHGDGKRPGSELPRNRFADLLWFGAWRRANPGTSPVPDYLVGTIVVIFGDREFMADWSMDGPLIDIPRDKTYPSTAEQCGACNGFGCQVCGNRGWLEAGHPQARLCWRDGCGKPLRPWQPLYCNNECAQLDA